MSSVPSIAPYAAVHDPSKLNGPGDSRPTALQIVKDENLVGKMQGKVMIVTGCSPGGIGVETARALHSTGADVYITVRSRAKGQETVDYIKSDNNPGKLEILEVELDSFDSIRAAAKDFLSKSQTLNVIVANAGIMATPEGRTKDGFESQFGTNHLGHFLLFQLLKPTLLASSTPEFRSRYVSVSSIGHRNSAVVFDNLNLEGIYNPWIGYGQSKTANILMSNEIERRYGARGLHSTSLDPGGIRTPLQKHMDQEVLDKYARDPESAKFGKSAAQGAATSVWAAVAREWNDKGGYFLQNCQVVPLKPENSTPFDIGFAKHAYDPEAEAKLWKKSLELVGEKDDQ